MQFFQKLIIRLNRAINHEIKGVGDVNSRFLNNDHREMKKYVFIQTASFGKLTIIAYVTNNYKKNNLIQNVSIIENYFR